MNHQGHHPRLHNQDPFLEMTPGGNTGSHLWTTSTWEFMSRQEICNDHEPAKEAPLSPFTHESEPIESSFSVSGNGDLEARISLDDAFHMLVFANKENCAGVGISSPSSRLETSSSNQQLTTQVAILAIRDQSETDYLEESATGDNTEYSKQQTARHEFCRRTIDASRKHTDESIMDLHQVGDYYGG